MSKKKKNEPAPIMVKENFLSELQSDPIYIDSKIVSLADLTGMPVDKGCFNAIISEGKIVSVVSPAYGFVPNDKFFYEVEHKLIEADIKYVTRSINRENKHFAVDYILSDDSYHVNVKNGNDRIMPMLRFTNSYAGGPVSGTFGLFREICANGLHVAQTSVGFEFRHKSNAMNISLERIGETVEKFKNNEFFSLHKKFEVLAETKIVDVNDFVKYTCTKLDLFKYEASEKNPDTPSAKAKSVMATIAREAEILGTDANYWLGYNAFNEAIHADKKSFMKQRKLDGELFSAVLEMASN